MAERLVPLEGLLSGRQSTPLSQHVACNHCGSAVSNLGSIHNANLVRGRERDEEDGGGRRKEDGRERGGNGSVVTGFRINGQTATNRLWEGRVRRETVYAS